MIFITFIYRFENDSNTYYGKYLTNYLSNDNDGLDNEVKNYLIKGIHKYRKKINTNYDIQINIKIGILSICLEDYVPFDSSKKEIECFDFYCINNNSLTTKKLSYYINGIEL